MAQSGRSSAHLIQLLQILRVHSMHFRQVFTPLSFILSSFPPSPVLAPFSQRLLAFYRQDWHSCAPHEKDQREPARSINPSLDDSMRWRECGIAVGKDVHFSA